MEGDDEMRKNACRIHLVLALVLVLFPGCNRYRVVLIYSPDRSQCISVITHDTCRYVVNGEYESVPDSGYVKLEFKKVPYMDCIYFRWRNEHHEWEAAFERSRVVESRLDTSRYKFLASLPRDSRGFPTVRQFFESQGGVLLFDGGKLIPEQSAIVEIR